MTVSTARLSAPTALILLLFAAFLGTIALFVPSIHAPAKHGKAEVARIREMFDHQGNCRYGDGAQMYSADLDTWMLLCFHSKDRLSIWVLSKHVSDPTAREITAIPANQMRNPIKYLRNVIIKRGYVLKNWNGTLPDWFLNSLK